MITLTEEMQKQINAFTCREHTPEELYAFEVCLCDNEIDRDRERFSLSALEQLKSLFVGKTGVFDHIPSSEKQSARIFATELRTDPDKTTAAGEPYTALYAYAYMVRTEKNEALIQEIEGGIKKEVSISCAAGAKTCSICGKERRLSACTHLPGESYGGKSCHVILDQITDAYEWSFVAVPAQRNAGVTKRFCATQPEDDPAQASLFHQIRLAEAFRQQVKKDIIKSKFCKGEKTGKAFSHVLEQMDLEELIVLRDELWEQEMAAPDMQLQPLSSRPLSKEDGLSAFSLR
jgi:hypothetical protein